MYLILYVNSKLSHPSIGRHLGFSNVLQLERKLNEHPCDLGGSYRRLALKLCFYNKYLARVYFE